MSSFKVDFFVVGAARCGTTSLYNYLKDHPQIFLPKVKEPNFFSKVSSAVEEDYELPEEGTSYHMKIITSDEVYQGLYSEATSVQLKGDISPSYLSNVETADRVHSHNPDARIIMSLRNPVARAFSHYEMNVASGYDTNETFEAALNAKQLDVWSGGNKYEEWSRYFDKVKSYYEVFDADQILVLVFEQWVAQPEKAVETICDFLKLDSTYAPDYSKKFNEKKAYKNIKTLNYLRRPAFKKAIDAILPTGTKQRLKESLFASEGSGKSLDPQLEKHLKEVFRQDVEDLAQITGKPLLDLWNFN